MRNIVAISGKEIRTYFASPTAYVVSAVFLATTGFLFAESLRVPNLREATVRGFLLEGWITIVLLLISLLLTMRLFAEEQKLGTLELLLTAPVRDFEVVVGKFLASLTIFAVMLALTLYYPILLFWFGDPDPGPIASGYLGFFLLGASFLSVGLLASSLTSNQIVSVVLGLGMLSFFMLIELAAGRVGSASAEVFNYLSITSHFQNFPWGVVDTKDVIYYLSFIIVFVFITVRSLETRRWR